MITEDNLILAKWLRVIPLVKNKSEACLAAEIGIKYMLTKVKRVHDAKELVCRTILMSLLHKY